jgi:hypothetical protein
LAPVVRDAGKGNGESAARGRNEDLKESDGIDGLKEIGRSDFGGTD